MAKMGRYILGRMLQALVTIIIVTTIIFLLFEAMPGDPLSKFRADPNTTEARLQQLENLYGLAKSVPMPGDYFTAEYLTKEVGLYNVTVTVTDKGSGSARTLPTYFEVTMDPEGDHSAPSILSLTHWQNDTSAIINATVTDDSVVSRVNVFLSGNNASERVAMESMGLGDFTATVSINSSVQYAVTVVALDSVNNNATATMEFDFNATWAKIWNTKLSQNVVNVNQTVTVTADIAAPFQTPIASLVSPSGESIDTVMVLVSGTTYTANVVPQGQGEYGVWIDAGGNVSAYQQLLVNTLATELPSPVSDGTVTNLITEPRAGQPLEYPYVISNDVVSRIKGNVIINVTAKPYKNFDVHINITTPGGRYDVLKASHPTRSVPTQIPERYIAFMTNMFTFNFGESYSMKGPVIDQIAMRAPRTLILFGMAEIIAFALGIAIGSYIAWRRGGIAEGSIISSSLFFYNMPSFWIGLIMIWVFANKWKFFPLGGFTGADETAAFFGLTGTESYFGILDFGWHMALPLLVMVLIGVAGVILLMRTSLLEVMREDYILTAKAKGLTERQVRIRHANRNAYLPIVTSFTLTMASVLGGAVILEQVFSYQGMGLLYLQALYNQDHFLSGAVLFILSLLVIFANIVADLLYGVLDPRVRL